ncbi:14-3-3 protein zeta-like [Daktulosphaira vitifoliae]|uniref:14-3-3 protein zeta-like n=1 Tax=Daktulosphaira vitifoliae TaxID=58002 RepID=UPI0021A9F6C4|nr:14-3-3 protein zeta-like [Daktulosphaira vitifoliae]
MDPEKEQIREQTFWKAKLAQEASRFEDMAKYMKIVAEINGPMSKEEDNMFAMAYKRILEHKRNSRRTLITIEQNDASLLLDKEIVIEYRSQIETELQNICSEVLLVIENTLIPKASNPSAKVFYWKLRGDYYRYMAELNEIDDRTTAVTESQTAYEQASEISRKSLCPTHPLRLGLMLNYSVFLYQICQEKSRGHQVANQAYEDAIAEMDVLEVDSYNDSTLIMRLLRDNIKIWNQENGGTPEDE